MKTRFAIAAVIGIVGLNLSSAWAILPPATAPLTNYDRRVELSSQPVAKATLAPSLVASPAPPTAADAAVALLESRVPGVRVTKDRILGTPSLISAGRGFLTGPDGQGKAVSAASLIALPADDPHRVIKAFLNEHATLFGHDASVLASANVSRDYVTEHNGLHTTVWEQTVDGIPVFEGLLVGHVTRDGELVSLSSHFVPDAVKAADTGTPNRNSLLAGPAISAANAIARAASNIGGGVAAGSLALVAAPQGAEQRQTHQSENLFGQAAAQLVWLPMNRDSMRLCWRVILSAKPRLELYSVLVDAENGDVLVRQCLTAYIAPATYNVFTNDSPSPMTPGWSTPSTAQPTNVPRSLVTLSALDTTASPLGWVNDGTNPPTSGNNAEAFLDRNLDGLPDVPLPTGVGANRLFDYPLDLTQAPDTYANASTVQLFYRANWYHDRLYQLGFTEAAGNFQSNNFALGGLGNDAVICLVQAGADVGESDNSMFSTPPDGGNGYCFMFVFTGPYPNRDGSLDQEVVCHELTHGTSGRMVGQGVGISQLQTGGMGEGWSDFYALGLLSGPQDDVNGCYPSGGYASYLLFGPAYNFRQNYYFGIRRYPYTTDMSKNPLTFKDIDPYQASAHAGVSINPLMGGGDPSEVHNQGEVWCVTLWEVRASLVQKSGWAVGNQLALQLVTDGMRLAPANPTFLEARDAIIQADSAYTGGDNYTELWTAFAKRGMGASATCPASDTTIGIGEAFDLPPDATPDGILEVKVTPPSSTVLFYGESIPVSVRVTDARSVTNATIVATASGIPNLVFRNNGQAPDAKANDSIYTATLNVPSSQTSLTITLVISAPDKLTSTNVVTYSIVGPAPNDNFTNATKVPVNGAFYLTSNKRATLETGEPIHAGVASAVKSLWWRYTPVVNTNVMVDAGGSDARTVLAVYTNDTLASLQPVVSAIGAGNRKGPFLYFTAHVGSTYQIAVASFDSNNVGTLRLNIAPGGQPDTNPPAVTLTSPLSGIMVYSNRLFLTGSAVDPDPTPSGIKNITISVTPIAANGPTTTTVVTPNRALDGPVSTNWTSVVGLSSGLNSVQVVAADFAGNQSLPVSIQAIYRPLDPPNDFFVNALDLTAKPELSTVNTTKATKEVGEPDHAGNVGGKSAWWTYRPPADGVLNLSTTNSTFDTLLAIYTGDTVSTLTPVGSNDDAYPGAPGGFSRLAQAVRGNTLYHIAVDGFNGASGVVYLSYAFTPAAIFHLNVTNTPGGAVTPLSGDFASNSIISLTATPGAFYEFDQWQGTVHSLDNPLSVVVTSDFNLTALFRPISFTDGFESGSFLGLGWTAAGNKPWVVQTNVVEAGRFAARSGAITNSQTSSLILSGNFHAGNGSFDYRVSSEAGWDFLGLYLDGNLVQSWSGELPWTPYAFPIMAGSHTLEWRYTKDPAGSAGLDAAFIDNVNLPLAVAANASAPATLSLFWSGNGAYIDGRGQTNQWYVIQSSTDLVTWQNIATNIAAGGTFRLLDLTAKTNQTQFYRAVVPVP